MFRGLSQMRLPQISNIKINSKSDSNFTKNRYILWQDFPLFTIAKAKSRIFLRRSATDRKSMPIRKNNLVKEDKFKESMARKDTLVAQQVNQKFMRKL